MIQKPVYPMRCLTTWGAVLDVSKIEDKEKITAYYNDRWYKHGRVRRWVTVHDPDTVDPGGQDIVLNDIVLLWRIKS